MKRTLNRSLYTILFIVSIFTEVPSCFATYLTITGQATLRATPHDGAFTLEGSYEIENRGDEIAVDVFPVFELDEWRWTGTPVQLKPNDKFSWDIKEKVPLSQISLPRRGQYALKILRYYRDGNRYQFSAPDVITFTLGELSDNERGSLQLPNIQAGLECNGDGEIFDCAFKVANSSKEDREVLLSALASHNLQIKLDSASIKVPSSATIQTNVTVKNQTGLRGSAYPIFAIAEWGEKELRQTNTVATRVLLKEPETTTPWYLFAALAGLVLVSCGVLYWFIFRKV